jgi:hypothetical protein
MISVLQGWVGGLGGLYTRLILTGAGCHVGDDSAHSAVEHCGIACAG